MGMTQQYFINRDLVISSLCSVCNITGNIFPCHAWGNKNENNNNNYDPTHVEVISHGENVYLFEIRRYLLEWVLNRGSMNGRLTSRHIQSIETSDIFQRRRFILTQNLTRHESVLFFKDGSPATYYLNFLLESTLPWLKITQNVGARSQVLLDCMLITVPFFAFQRKTQRRIFET